VAGASYSVGRTSPAQHDPLVFAAEKKRPLSETLAEVDLHPEQTPHSKP